MPKAGSKTTTKAGIDHNSITLSRRMLKLREQEIDATSHLCECEDATLAAKARVDAVWEEMDHLFEQLLTLTPVTSEGRQILAAAIGAKCANHPELNQPETEFERGAGALFRALGVDPQRS